MKRHISLTIAVGMLALASPAFAADLVQAAPVAAVAPGAWDGAYIGASVGYGWGTANDGSANASLTGALLGAQIGYNFHFSDSLVAGLEGNIDWAHETGSFPITTTFAINWAGSARARLGVDLGQVLPYAEVGVAFANATYTNLTNYDATHVGWTVGTGAELALADSLSLNLEYRYSDYGSQTHKGIAMPLTDSTIRLGLNLHL